MWTARIKQIDKGKGDARIQMEFTDGSRVVGKDIAVTSGNLAWLRQQVKNEITRLAALDEFVDSLTPGTILPLEETPVPASEQDRILWSSQFRKLQGIGRAVEQGILTGTETMVSNLRNTVKNTFKPEYLDSI